MTDDEAVQAGDAAQACFDSEAFRAAVKVVADGYVAEWRVEAEASKRDVLWYKQRAIVDVVAELRAVASRGAHILATMKREREQREANEKAARNRL